MLAAALALSPALLLAPAGCGEDATPPRAPSGKPAAPNPPSDSTTAAPVGAERTLPPVPGEVPDAVDPEALDPEVRAAIADARASVEAARDDGDRWLLLADLLLAHSETAGAAAAYTGAVALLGPRARERERAEYLRAVALDESGDAAGAAEALAETAATSRTARVHWRLALILANEGRLDEAVAEASRAASLDPRDPRAHAALAQTASEAGRFELAAEAARNGLRLNPRNGHLYSILAASLRAEGDLEGAERLVGAGRHSRADWLDPWLGDLRRLRLGKGAAKERFYSAIRAKDLESAQAALTAFAAATGDEGTAPIALMRAQLALESNDAVGARAALDEARGEGVSDCEFAVTRALVDARQAIGSNSLEGIIGQLDALECRDDQEATRLELIGSMRLAQGAWVAAADALVAADGAREAGTPASLRKAIARMAEAGAFPPAMRLAERLHEVEPLNPEPCFVAASLSLRQGDIEAAQRWAERLVELAPENPNTKRLLGQIENAVRRPPTTP